MLFFPFFSNLHILKFASFVSAIAPILANKYLKKTPFLENHWVQCTVETVFADIRLHPYLS